MKGKLIVLDGTDGCGKKTQTEKLVERLRQEGQEVVMQDFPRYGERSAAIVEDYLNGKFGTAEQVGPYRASIFYACDRFAASTEIFSALESAKHVVSNRYVSANMGHQSGKIKDLTERDKFLDWLDNLEYGIFGISRPDLQILLFTNPSIAQSNVDKKGHRDYMGGSRRDIHEADINHLNDAADAFLYCAKKFNWNVVDCMSDGKMRSVEEIHDEVYRITKNRIDQLLKSS